MKQTTRNQTTSAKSYDYREGYKRGREATYRTGQTNIGPSIADLLEFGWDAKEFRKGWKAGTQAAWAETDK